MYGPLVGEIQDRTLYLTHYSPRKALAKRGWSSQWLAVLQPRRIASKNFCKKSLRVQWCYT